MYARLSAAEQHRVFAPHRRRRVVLATNVAETSLTVPGIRYVVDTGLARISRFSARTKVQRLPIEPISQASANQRKGRCGRVAAGICIRLYAEDDFEARAEFTEPEILRTNLASVILQMTSLDLGDVARFPFVEPPDTRSVQAGIQLLEEIGAITTSARASGTSQDADSRPGLTRIGRQLAQLPVDPRLARMLRRGRPTRLPCARSITVVAALSMQDPRERPADQQELADQRTDGSPTPTSDFAGDPQPLALRPRAAEGPVVEHVPAAVPRRVPQLPPDPRVAGPRRAAAPGRQAARPARVSKDAGCRGRDPPQSLLAGLLSHIGLQGRRAARLPRRPRHPVRDLPRLGVCSRSSPSSSWPPSWSRPGRLWARVNAAFDPAWAEQLGAHLVKRTYSEPHWEKQRGAVSRT